MVLAPTLVVCPVAELFALSVVLEPDASVGVVACALTDVPVFDEVIGGVIVALDVVAPIVSLLEPVVLLAPVVVVPALLGESVVVDMSFAAGVLLASNATSGSELVPMSGLTVEGVVARPWLDDAEALTSPAVVAPFAEGRFEAASGSIGALLVEASDGFDDEVTVRSGMLGAIEADMPSAYAAPPPPASPTARSVAHTRRCCLSFDNFMETPLTS